MSLYKGGKIWYTIVVVNGINESPFLDGDRANSG